MRSIPERSGVDKAYGEIRYTCGAGNCYGTNRSHYSHRLL